ncbi:hypothetical protein M3O96_18060 [Aquiflexum sp. TKW24L]|uniref:hypothetical protein n=1 Tax=Aquiflexum sp. TKW24L TaxID=2942212 RepID=UPI0020BEDB82|nr:hypothetical protein [Aquiflexum sp. TKW24L]MCL6261014.1 hypothetical protein [Aquiflexum sp. TKW24L]
MSNQNENKSLKLEPEELNQEGLDDVQDQDSTTEYDLTAEDRQALGPKDLSMDGGEDEELLSRKRPVDFAGEDLDIPGRELDDAQELTGNEDEENNHYSLGSDDNEELERE